MRTNIPSVFLPSEIVDSIICQISDTQTLLCSSVVSRLFCVPSQVQIFRYVGRESSPGSDHSYKDRMEKFGNVITQPTSAHLRKLVRTIRLKEDLLEDPDASTFRALLLLPNIDTLILSSITRLPFSWSRLSPRVRSILENTVFPQLRSLTIRRVMEIPFSKFLEQCPMLETLELVICNLRRCHRVIYSYLAAEPSYTPEAGDAPLALSLRHLKVWGMNLTSLNSNPEWLAFNTGFIKSLTIGRNMLDHIDNETAVLARILEKNRNSLEIVKVLNNSFIDDLDYLNMFSRLPNLKLLVVHVHWSILNPHWQTFYCLQRVTQVLIDPTYAIPPLYLLLSNIGAYAENDGLDNDDDNESDTSRLEKWERFDGAICSRPDVKLIMGLRETQSEALAFNQMRSYIESYLPLSARAGLLDIRQYEGPVGGRWDLVDEADEQNERWEATD
ncbi:hypothetical protein DL96DRAFT_1688904 [Flagelloscypha sp. PMI_526]|nr:hypothetical protein DL96DRAFT_1688904 [Flagelloscypha sp. PMI_526]